MLDLDGFGAVNERSGRDVGDRLLVAVAARLRQVVAPHLLARTGGDEFTVLVDDPADPAAVHDVGVRVCETLRVPFRVGERSVTLSAGVGVAVATARTAGSAGLMRAADVALSWAKARGRGRGRGVRPRPRRGGVGPCGAGGPAWRRDGAGEFRLHYQPLVDLADGRVRGTEALVRWQHPEHGLLTPGRFVEAAERTGAIVAAGPLGAGAGVRPGRGLVA